MNYLKLILPLFLLMTTLSSWSAVPTVEGLFRNAQNPDLGGELVVLKLLVNEDKKLENIKLEEASESDIQEGVAKELSQTFIKFIFNVEKDKPLNFIQVVYHSGEMKRDQVERVNFFKNPNDLKEKLATKEKKLFYSLITLLGLNNGQFIKEFIKTQSPDFIENKEALNTEKVNLYKDYKNYLTSINEDKELKESLENPLKPTDPETAEKVREVLKQNMFVKNEQVKLIKVDKSFFWKVTLEKIEALFENESNRIRELTIKGEEGESKVVFDDYILFNGKHELPKKVILTKNESEKYEITFLSTQHFSLNKKSKKMRKRLDEYNEWLSQSSKKDKKYLSGKNLILGL